MEKQEITFYFQTKFIFMAKFHISKGTDRDLELLVEHRMKMWKEIHPDQKEQVEMIRPDTREWITDLIKRGILTSFIVKDETGNIAGSGCVMVRDDQVRIKSTLSRVPYLMSMYTETGFRNMGVATLIVGKAIEWARENGFDRMLLHASRAGRGVYEKFGFKDTSEMRMWMK